MKKIDTNDIYYTNGYGKICRYSRFENNLHDTLTESSLSRLKKHSDNGCLFISASRNNFSPEENKARSEMLASYIRAEGLGYIPLIGGYVENNNGEDIEVVEESFLVPKTKYISNKEFFEFAIDMCDKFKQDSVLINIPGFCESGYYDNTGTLDTPIGTDLSFSADNVKKYFSHLVSGTKNSQVKFAWIAKKVPHNQYAAVKMDNRCEYW